MSLEADFLTRLLAVAPIAAIVGDRISWFELPREGGLPAGVLTPIVAGRLWTHSGANGLVNPRVRIDWWAEDPDVAEALRMLGQAEMERTENVTAGGTIFMPPGTLEADEAITDVLGDVGGQGGVPLYRWLQEFTFFAKPAA